MFQTLVVIFTKAKMLHKIANFQSNRRLNKYTILSITGSILATLVITTYAWRYGSRTTRTSSATFFNMPYKPSKPGYIFRVSSEIDLRDEQPNDKGSLVENIFQL